jgi:hypothetical protein
MIHDSPYTGIGLNTFPWVMDRFYPGFLLGPEVHAHSFLLQTGADFGLPGLLALVWLLVAFAFALGGAYRGATNPSSQWLCLALGTGLTGFLAFGTIDAITLGAKPGLAFWVLLGLGVSLGLDPTRRVASLSAWSRRVDLALLVLLVLALLAPVAWGGPWQNLGRVLAARELLEPSVAPDGATRLVVARAALAEANAADPGNSGAWFVRGMVHARLDEQAEAIGAFRQGVLVDRQAPLRRYALGDALFGSEPASGWSSLRQVYERWTIRYPKRAEWYVTLAVVLEEGFNDWSAALALVERGLALGAEPRALLEAYRDDSPPGAR